MCAVLEPGIQGLEAELGNPHVKDMVSHILKSVNVQCDLTKNNNTISLVVMSKSSVLTD